MVMVVAGGQMALIVKNFLTLPACLVLSAHTSRASEGRREGPEYYRHTGVDMSVHGLAEKNGELMLGTVLYQQSCVCSVFQITRRD